MNSKKNMQADNGVVLNRTLKADGYVKYKTSVRKFYRAQTYLGGGGEFMGNGRVRHSAKVFKRAADALAYGDALVARYKRLKAAEIAEIQVA